MELLLVLKTFISVFTDRTCVAQWTRNVNSSTFGVSWRGRSIRFDLRAHGLPAAVFSRFYFILP